MIMEEIGYDKSGFAYSYCLRTINLLTYHNKNLIQQRTTKLFKDCNTFIPNFHQIPTHVLGSKFFVNDNI